MQGTIDLRRGQIIGDASRRWVHGNAVSYAYAGATYAPLASPTFTGDPKAPTPAPGDNDTSIATTAFVNAAVAAGGGITQLTGDATAGPGSGSQAVTLATVNGSIGTFQGITVNAKGQVTAAVNQNYVTGGPYLPTAGGTMTGTLSLPALTATSSVTVSSGYVASQGATAGYYFEDHQTPGPGHQWELVSVGGNATLYNQSSGVNALILSPTGTANFSGGLYGTQTNNNAAAGNVGEYINSAIFVASAVPLTTNTPANVTSLSLSAGDWEVTGTAAFHPAGTTTISQVIGQIGTTSAALNFSGDVSATIFLQLPSAETGSDFILSTGARRLSIAATSVVYLVVQASFGVSTLGGYGSLQARRMR